MPTLISKGRRLAEAIWRRTCLWREEAAGFEISEAFFQGEELRDFPPPPGVAEVGHPTPQEGIEPFDNLFQALPAGLPLHLADFLHQPLAALGRDSELRFLVPRHTVAQELPLPRTRHRALGRIDLQLQSLLQKRRDCRHHPLPCPLAAIAHPL